NFFGTGFCLYVGVVFKMTPAGSLTVLREFTGANGDGAYPFGLVRAADGNLYGATSYGGDGPTFWGHGTVFRVASDGTVSTFYTFTDGTDGALPGGVVAGLDGNLYGVARDHG